MSSISVEVKNHIAIVTLDRAPINSLVREAYYEIRDIFAELGDREGVRVAVLRAHGRFFCPGNDVSEFENLTEVDDIREAVKAVSECMSSVYSCAVPVVAAVHGHAYGAGMALAACADILVASDSAQFCIPEIKVGVIGASGFLALLVPEKVVRYMSLTGNAISAQKVEQYGGVHKIVPTGEVFDAAMEVAQDLLKQGPISLRHFKAAMNINQQAQLVEKYAVEASFTESYAGTAEARESVNAFLQGRPADHG